ncbi:MAG TPA: glycosyltransferase [Roseimicrobium sp.]|nr:glycosyltransferase [Roseimicrobium sp.]
MSQPLPFVSVIIAVHPKITEVKSVAAAGKIDYPRDRFEIIVARGDTIPAVKRNAALHGAKGKLVFFLDDDSVPRPGDLRRAVELFSDPAVKAVGGPNLCPPEAPELEHAFALAMGNRLAFGPSAARYRSIGQRRPTSEKELILCNMLARREELLAVGGFDEKLYPNEENVLLDNIQKRGGTLLYDPEQVVFRRPRSTWGAFLRMLMTYGRGRAEQLRLHPSAGSILNLVPPAFCAYLVLLPFLPSWCMWPLLAYALLLLSQPFVTGPARLTAKLQLPILVGLSHLLYGLGFWRGLFTRPQPGPSGVAANVRLDVIQSG